MPATLLTITARGPGQMALLLLALVAWPLAHHLYTYPLDAVHRERIRQHLALRYQREAVARLALEAQSPSPDHVELQRLAAEVERRGAVKLESATAKGLLGPKYVRAEISVNGGPPPDGRRVRYFRLRFFDARPGTGFEYFSFFW